MTFLLAEKTAVLEVNASNSKTKVSKCKNSLIQFSPQIPKFHFKNYRISSCQRGYFQNTPRRNFLAKPQRNYMKQALN